MGTGIQSSFEVSGSSDSSKNESFALKERRDSSDSAVVYSGYDEISYSDVTTSHSDVHLQVSLGTETTGIGFSINQSQSSVIKSTSIQYDEAVPGSDPPAGVETHYFTTMHSVKGKEESSSGFGIALGTDATGTAADELQNEGSYSAFSEIDSWQISRIENYLNVPGDVYRWAQLDYERHEVEAGSDSDAVGGSAVLHWAGMTDSLPARPAVVLTALPAVPDGRSLQSILDEYLDRATKLARLQAQLNDTTDPAMRQYLQGLINTEQNILNDLATQATAAGATSSDLSDLDAQAQAAAAGDPIGLQTWDGGDSVTGA